MATDEQAVANALRQADVQGSQADVPSPRQSAELRKVRTPDGSLACFFCGSTKFRRSRLQIEDLKEVLMLRYPLRCMRCNQRQYGYFLTASLAHAAKSYR